jgi:hypothetical protein
MAGDPRDPDDSATQGDHDRLAVRLRGDEASITCDMSQCLYCSPSGSSTRRNGASPFSARSARSAYKGATVRFVTSSSEVARSGSTNSCKRSSNPLPMWME